MHPPYLAHGRRRDGDFPQKLPPEDSGLSAQRTGERRSPAVVSSQPDRTTAGDGGSPEKSLVSDRRRRRPPHGRELSLGALRAAWASEDGWKVVQGVGRFQLWTSSSVMQWVGRVMEPPSPVWLCQGNRSGQGLASWGAVFSRPQRRWRREKLHGVHSGIPASCLGLVQVV